MTFVRRLAIGSTLLLTILSGVLMYGARALSSGYNCLHLSGAAMLVDVHTGYSVPTWNSVTNELLSPDRQYAAYLTFLADGYHNRLSVRAAGSEQERFLHENVGRFMWSADSRYMAYMWRDDGGLGQIWLTIANADGSDARSTVLDPDVTDFYGLSADNEYVAFTTTDSLGSALNFLSVPDFQLNSTYMRGDYPFRVEWSPQGHDLIYPSYNQEFGGISFTWVSVVSPEGREVTLPLPQYPNFIEFIWSPDERTVGVHYTAETERPEGQAWQTRLDLISLDGSIISDVAVAVGANDMSLPPVIWSEDSRSLVAWNGQVDGSLALERFYPANGQRETLIANVWNLLSYSPDHERTAIPVEDADSSLNLEVMDADGGNRTTLVEDPYPTARGPYYGIRWSPDNQALAVTWGDGQSIYWSGLAWALADGSEIYQLEDVGFISDVLWISDGQVFVYTAINHERWSVELVNPHTEMHQILLDNLVSVDSMEEDGQSGGITFRWQTADGQAGFDTYEPDGERIQRFILAGAAIPVDEGNSPRNLFWSPNGSRALLVFDADGSRGLQLSSTDGESHVIRSKLPWIYPPYWSPDERMLAFTAVNLPSETTLDVVTANGENVAQFDQFPMLVNVPQMEWTRCEPRPR